MTVNCSKNFRRLRSGKAYDRTVIKESALHFSEQEWKLNEEKKTKHRQHEWKHYMRPI